MSWWNRLLLKNIKTGEESEFETNGVFIFIGTTPKTELIQGTVRLNKQGYIITDEKMDHRYRRRICCR